MRVLHRVTSLVVPAILTVLSCRLALGAVADPAEPAPSVVPSTLSLTRAIETALQYNPRVAASSQGIEAAAGAFSQAVSGLLPRIDVSAARATPLNLPAFSFQSPDSAWSTDFTLSQPLYAGGRLRAGVRAAREVQGASRAVYRRTVQEIAFAVRGSYYAVLTAEQGVQVAQEVLDSALEQARVAKLRYEAGVAPHFDVLSADARVARVEQSLISAQSDLDIARAALSAVIGVPLPVDTELTTPRFAARTEGDLGALVQEGLRRRPDLLALRAEADAARERVSVARAGRWPTLSATLSWTLREKTTIPGDVFGVPGAEITVSQNSGFLAVAANWGLYTGGQVEGEVKETKARWKQSQDEVARQELEVELAVTRAYVLLSAATAQIAAAQRELVQAEEAQRVANIRYQEGVSTSVEILDAEAALEGAKTRLNQAIFDRDLAVAALDLAVGREWRELMALEEPEVLGGE